MRVLTAFQSVFQDSVACGNFCLHGSTLAITSLLFVFPRPCTTAVQSNYQATLCPMLLKIGTTQIVKKNARHRHFAKFWRLVFGTFWNPFASLKKLDRLSKLCKRYSNWPFWIFLVHLVKSFAATRISHIVQNICPFLVYATTLLPALSKPLQTSPAPA
jgi:hypothetical protein